MVEFNAKLGVKGAVIGILLLVAFSAFQYFHLAASLGSDAVQPVKDAIYQIHVSRLMDHKDEPVKLLENAKALDKINVKSMSARRISDGYYVLKVFYDIDGKTPADDSGTRYFKAEWQAIGGWRIKWESNAFSYYSAFRLW